VRLRSELPVSAPRSRSGPADIVVRSGARVCISAAAPPGELIAEVRWADGRGYALTRDERGYTLRYCKTCEFRFHGDWSRGTVDRDPDADERIASLLLAGNVLGWYLSLRGEPPLHASAVQLNGQAIAFAGGSGTGKSTFAALACRQGGTLITDDLLRLRVGDEARCYFGAGELRLREGAAELADGMGFGARSASVDGRVTVAFPSEGSLGPPLRAIVLPKPSRTCASLELGRLTPARALFALNGCPRISG
jgi:hypothetical protein